MKNVIGILSMALLAFALAGCTSNYAMSTNDGRTIISKGKPIIDNQTGLISYADANGHKQQINRREIKEMTEIN